MRLTALAGMWPWVRAHCPHDANERVQPSYGTKGHHILTSSIIRQSNKRHTSCVLTPGLLRGAVWTKRRCQKRTSVKSSSRQPSNRRAGTRSSRFTASTPCGRAGWWCVATKANITRHTAISKRSATVCSEEAIQSPP